MIVKMCRERDSNPHSHYWPRDFNLGKVVLYQLSYFRKE